MLTFWSYQTFFEVMKNDKCLNGQILIIYPPKFSSLLYRVLDKNSSDAELLAGIPDSHTPCTTLVAPEPGLNPASAVTMYANHCIICF